MEGAETTQETREHFEAAQKAREHFETHIAPELRTVAGPKRCFAVTYCVFDCVFATAHVDDAAWGTNFDAECARVESGFPHLRVLGARSAPMDPALPWSERTADGGQLVSYDLWMSPSVYDFYVTKIREKYDETDNEEKVKEEEKTKEEDENEDADSVA